MPTVKLSPIFNGQTLSPGNAIASGYKLFTYAAGSSTKQATYTDNTGTVAHTNPIIIDANGYTSGGPVWLIAGQNYKFVLTLPTDTDPPTTPIETLDNISGVNDTTTGVTQWVASGAAPTYINSNSFSLAGDQTTEFHIGRRVQITIGSGTLYGTIYSSVFSTITTIKITLDSGSLDVSLSSISLSILRADNLAPPLSKFEIGAMHNRIINGDMRIDQRNAGGSQSFISGNPLAYCVDRFFAYSVGATITGQQINFGSEKRYRLTGAAPNSSWGFGQRIEAANCFDIAGNTVTLQAKLSSTSLTSITWTAYYANSINTFGTIASPTKTQIATGTFTIGSSELAYNVQIPIPNVATTGVEIIFSGGALLSGQTFTIGDIELINSPVADIYFPRRPFAVEILNCQRHFEKTHDYAASPSSVSLMGRMQSTITTAFLLANGSCRFKVEKGGTPTIVVFSTSTGSANVLAEYNTSGAFVADRGISVSNIATSGFELVAAGTATAGNNAGWQYTSTWEL